MLLGFGIGVFYVVSLIIAFAVGYGWNNNQDEEEIS